MQGGGAARTGRLRAGAPTRLHMRAAAPARCWCGAGGAAPAAAAPRDPAGPPAGAELWQTAGRAGRVPASKEQAEREALSPFVSRRTALEACSGLPSAAEATMMHAGVVVAGAARDWARGKGASKALPGRRRCAALCPPTAPTGGETRLTGAGWDAAPRPLLQRERRGRREQARAPPPVGTLCALRLQVPRSQRRAPRTRSRCPCAGLRGQVSPGRRLPCPPCQHPGWACSGWRAARQHPRRWRCWSTRLSTSGLTFPPGRQPAAGRQTAGSPLPAASRRGCAGGRRPVPSRQRRRHGR